MIFNFKYSKISIFENNKCLKLAINNIIKYKINQYRA